MKTIFAILLSLGTIGNCVGQGLIDWSAAPGGNILGQTNAAAYSPFFGGGSSGFGATGFTSGASVSGTAYYYTLLYDGQNTTGVPVSNPTNGSLSTFLNTWFSTGLYATNTGTGGRINYISPNGQATLPWGGNMDANGQSNNIVLAGWSQNLGTTWASVSNNLANWYTFGALVTGGIAYFGISNPGFLVGTDSPAIGASWSALTPGTQTPTGLLLSAPSASPLEMYLLPIPEPSTLALAGLGGLGLLLFRRRK